jgi:hypothetical protein
MARRVVIAGWALVLLAVVCLCAGLHGRADHTVVQLAKHRAATKMSPKELAVQMKRTAAIMEKEAK